MVKIEITDSEGKKITLTGDRAFGCVMTRKEAGATKCDSYLVGGGVQNDVVMGPVMDGVILCAKEIAEGNPLIMALNLGAIRASLDCAVEEFITKGKGGVQNGRN